MFSWAHLGLVVVGGMLGTAARAALMLLFGEAWGAWLVPAVNVTGALALGAVIGVLSRSASTARSRAIQHFLGAGVLGGFTTYSALAVESAADPALLILGVGSALVGTAAAGAGLLLTRRRPRGAT